MAATNTNEKVEQAFQGTELNKNKSLNIIGIKKK